MSMLPEYPSNPIAYLLRRRFGDAEQIGPVSGLLEDEEETQTQLYAEIQTYRDELQGLEEQELIARAYQEREKEAVELEDLEEQLRFFSHPNAQADFQHWATLPLWTLDEAVALTLGKTPLVVTWPQIEEHTETSPFAARFASLRHFVHRAKEAQQLSDLVPPTEYVAWAKAKHIVLPPELEESIEASSGTAPDWKSLYEDTKLKLASVTDELERLKAADKALSEKEKRTFYKLFLGMAITFHGYDPHATGSTIPKEITDELKESGISIDVDTVRDKLQKASDVFGDLVPKLDKE